MGQELIVEQTTRSEVLEFGGQELIVEQTTCNEVVEAGKQELIVEQTTCSEVEIREQKLSKPKLMRQETLGMGRTENSRFRNKNFEFTEDDPIHMRTFTPIMNLVVKTTYETDEAYQAAMEKRRRGLKLKRSEEAEGELDFTLHVTQTHINLVAKALGQLVTEEPKTTTRSLGNLVTQTTISGVEVGKQQPRVNRPPGGEVPIREQELIVEQTSCREAVEVGGQELIVEQTTCNEGSSIKEAGIQFVEKAEGAIAGLFQEAENAIAGSIQEAENAIAGTRPKFMRQETSNMGRTENSRFRNKNFEFTEDDPVQMKTFTPIMNLVIKTTYETDEAYQAAMEKRRRGLKLKRSEEAEEGLDFTLHVTQTHINLVAK